MNPLFPFLSLSLHLSPSLDLARASRGSVGVLVQTGALLDVGALDESAVGLNGHDARAAFAFPGAPAAHAHDPASLAVTPHVPSR